MRKSTSMPSLQTRASLPLNAIRRPRDTPTWKLATSLKTLAYPSPRIIALVGTPSGALAGEDLRQLADREKRRLALARDLVPDRHASDRPIELESAQTVTHSSICSRCHLERSLVRGKATRRRHRIWSSPVRWDPTLLQQRTRFASSPASLVSLYFVDMSRPVSARVLMVVSRSTLVQRAAASPRSASLRRCPPLSSPRSWALHPR
jgi:hypothetical protein